MHDDRPLHVTSLESQLLEADTDEARLPILAALAAHHRREGDDDALVDTLQRRLEAMPDEPATLSELSLLHETAGRSDLALAALRRLERVSMDRGERLEIRGRIADLLDRMGDPEGAIDAFRDASIGRQTLIHNLKALSERASVAAQRALYFYEIGRVYEELGNAVSARSYFETALGHDPTLVPAAERLIDAHLARGQLDRARPLLATVVEAQKSRPDISVTMRHRRLLEFAQASREAGDVERARHAFESAIELGPDDPATMLGLADLLYDQGERELPRSLYERLHLEHEDALSRDTSLRTCLRTGRIEHEVGDMQAAVRWLERAVQLAPGNGEARRMLVDSLERAQDWERVVEHTRYLMERERDPTLRFNHLIRIGELSAHQLERPDLAQEAWEAALELQPRSVAVLRSLLEMWQRAARWSEAVGVLERLAALEADQTKRAKLYYTIGILYRDQLDLPVPAVRYFDQALDIDVEFWSAFDAIDGILAGVEEWKELERAYRRMLRRVAERGRSGQLERLELRLREGLAAVYASAGDHDEELVAEHRALIDLDLGRIDSHHALFDAYLRAGELDRAWCVAGALMHLQRATPAEQELYEHHRDAGLKLPERPLSPAHYRLLYHPDQDPALSALVEELSQSLRPFYARLIREWGLNPRRHIVAKDSPLPVARLFREVARVLDIRPTPLLFLREDEPGELRNLNHDPPAFLVGRDLLDPPRPDHELACLCARRLTWARPEHYLAAVFPPELVHAMVMAALHVAAPDRGIDRALGKRAKPLIREIESLPPTAWIRLSQHARVFFDRGVPPDVPAWIAAVEQTTLRIALLLTGDLDLVTRHATPDAATTAPAPLDLLRFALSDAHHELRRDLGIALA